MQRQFPKEIWLIIIHFFDVQSIGILSCANKHFRYLLAEEGESLLWKPLTLRYFPYFFWGFDYNNNTFDSCCKCCDCAEPSNHPFNKLEDSAWRATFKQIYSGQWSGLLHVLNSLENRHMSAFLAVATFDKMTRAFNVAYSSQLIAQYRNGNRILLKADESDEVIPITDSWKLKRVPTQLITEDPRSLHSSEMFKLELSTDGRPLLHPGTEVEVQWRMSRATPYSWWRGFVRGSFLDPSLCFDVATPSTMSIPTSPSSPNPSSSRILPNNPLPGGGREEGILVEFPQFPPSSTWRFVIVSLLGLEVENFDGLGFLGGIRKVVCTADSRKWAKLFDISMEEIQRNEAEGHAPQGEEDNLNLMDEDANDVEVDGDAL